MKVTVHLIGENRVVENGFAAIADGFVTLWKQKFNDSGMVMDQHPVCQIPAFRVLEIEYEESPLPNLLKP